MSDLEVFIIPTAAAASDDIAAVLDALAPLGVTGGMRLDGSRRAYYVPSAVVAALRLIGRPGDVVSFTPTTTSTAFTS